MYAKLFIIGVNKYGNALATQTPCNSLRPEQQAAVFRQNCALCYQNMKKIQGMISKMNSAI